MTIFIIPHPRIDKIWKNLVKLENLPEPKYHDSICSQVTLPANWVILPSGYRNNFIIYDDNALKRGMIYMTDKVGFTVFYKN